MMMSRPRVQTSAWSSLLLLVREALQRSDHPFTFLWLLAMLQQFVHRSDLNKLKAKAQKELREVTGTLLNTICLIAGRVCLPCVPPILSSYNSLAL